MPAEKVEKIISHGEERDRIATEASSISLNPYCTRPKEVRDLTYLGITEISHMFQD